MTHVAVFLLGLFCGVVGVCLFILRMTVRRICLMQGDKSWKAQWQLIREVLTEPTTKVEE